MKRERKVRIAELAEVRRGRRLAIGIDHLRQLADVAAGDGQGHVACPGTVLEPGVRVAIRLGLGRVPYLDQPGHVTQEVHVAAVANP
jgi:hypothetical protein